MLQLIISITSSSGRGSANVWHASASVDVHQSRLNELWNEARWERKKNKTASRGKKEKEKKKWSRRKKKEKKGKKQYECQAKSQESAPFHTIAISIPQRRKSERKRKVTLQWPWNYWFHRESLWEKQAQLLWVLTTLGPDHCFRASRWIYPVVFSVLWQFSHKLARNISSPRPQQLPSRCDNWCSRTFVWKNQQTVFIFLLVFPRCVTVLSSVINDISHLGSLQPCTCRDWYVDRPASAMWHDFCLIRSWLMEPVDQGQDHDIWPPLWMCQGERLMHLNKPVTATLLWSLTYSFINGRG